MFEFFRKANMLLGMNARNLEYVRPLNPKKARAVSDDKILSKKVLSRAGVNVPGLIAQIESHEALDSFDWSTLPNSFVVKPNRGFGGGGIMVVFARKKGMENAWVKADGSVITAEELRDHVRNIIDGMYSLAGVSDIAFFEERLTLLKLFKPYAYRGIPDLRIIVYNKVPVMGMLRLPTRESGGKANLQQGGVGVGIDMATGTTTTAIQGKGRVIEYAPGTRMLLSGIRIPYWDEILEMSVRAQEASGLGYLGADVAIDRERGPVFLELNARPGLSIQVANMAGLKNRLNRVAGVEIKTAKKGVRMGKDLFGGEIEQGVEQRSGKRVIGSIEEVTLIGKDGAEVAVQAKIDTGAYSSSIDYGLARALGFGDIIDSFQNLDHGAYEIVRSEMQEIRSALRTQMQKKHKDLADVAVVFSSSGTSARPVVEVTFVMDDMPVQAKVNIVDRSDLTYDMIVGKRNLGKFLVDVTKTPVTKNI